MANLHYIYVYTHKRRRCRVKSTNIFRSKLKNSGIRHTSLYEKLIDTFMDFVQIDFDVILNDLKMARTCFSNKTTQIFMFSSFWCISQWTATTTTMLNGFHKQRARRSIDSFKQKHLLLKKRFRLPVQYIYSQQYIVDTHTDI